MVPEGEEHVQTSRRCWCTGYLKVPLGDGESKKEVYLEFQSSVCGNKKMCLISLYRDSVTEDELYRIAKYFGVDEKDVRGDVVPFSASSD